ncbi:hypothetical protein FGF1_35910 [Flavobacteriaceae bacterium GF1]
MASHKTKSLALLTDLYVNQRAISQVYSYVGLATHQSSNLLAIAPAPSPDKHIYSFTYVPDYIKAEISNPDLWKEKTFPSVNGYAICLHDCPSIEDYLRNNLKSRRKAINRAVKRLETCFNISYKVFQKNTTEDEYHFLMGKLKTMIIKRFEQRGQKSDSLAVWDKVVSTSLDLIKQGKASLFVIYDEDNPIVISFNYNYDTMLFSYISSYDIDYAKFSPGQIEIYRQLEWCINNGYTQYDMGWGDMAYKKWWSNKIYRFNHHILYPKHSIPGFLYALRKGNKSRIFAFLIAKGVNTRLNKIKKILRQDHKISNNGPQYTFGEATLSPSESWEEIDLRTKELPISKQIINDFLFLTQEHSEDVSLHYSKTKDIYALKGKKEVKTIVFNNINN